MNFANIKNYCCFKLSLRLLCSVLILPVLGHTEEATFIKKKQNLLLLKYSGELVIGASLKVKLGGEECSGSVRNKKGSQVIFQIAGCSIPASLQKGNRISFTSEKQGAGPNDENDIFDEGRSNNLEIAGANTSSHMAFAIVPGGSDVRSGDFYNLFFVDRSLCPLVVSKRSGNKAYFVTKKCKQEYEIRKGLRLEFQTRGALKTRNGKYVPPQESMYFMFSLGLPKFMYSGKDKEYVDSLNNDSSVSHFALSADILGIYFPAFFNNLYLGGVISVLRDAFSGSGIQFELYQIQIGASGLFFFNKKSLTRGWFLRSDLGVSRYTSTTIKSATTGATVGEPTKTGFGVVGGGGYSLPISDRADLMLGLTLGYRAMSDSKIMTLNLFASLLF